jgi:hypothetical protein
MGLIYLALYCSEQASKAVSAEESLLGGCDYVYPWEDWVTVFYRHRQHTLDGGVVPINSRYIYTGRSWPVSVLENCPDFRGYP